MARPKYLILEFIKVQFWEVDDVNLLFQLETKSIFIDSICVNRCAPREPQGGPSEDQNRRCLWSCTGCSELVFWIVAQPC